jgi:phage-related tail fiber protein
MVDQNSQFYAILTNVGAAKQANADALGVPWKIMQMAVGDANGTDPTPNATQTSLLNEWRRAPLNQLKVDDKDPAIIIAEQVIPADVGGHWIREIALYDADGDMVAVANCAPTYKPLLSQGSGRTQVVRMNLVVSSSSNVQLKVDPSVVLATREFVLEELARQDFKHSVSAATTAAITLSGLQTIDGVALTAGARVLVKNQAAAKDNGLYTVVAGGAWTRCTDADSAAKVTPGLLVLVERGTVNADSAWQLVTDAPITLGVTGLAFEMAFGRTGVAAGTYRSVQVDAYGRVLAGTNPTTVAGYGLTDVYTRTQVDSALAAKAPLASPALTGIPTAPTPPKGTNTIQLATTEFVLSEVLGLVDSAPGALDTLKELAAALGNDPNFSTTVLNELAKKAPLASPAFTGTPTAPVVAPLDASQKIATTAHVYASQHGLIGVDVAGAGEFVLTDDQAGKGMIYLTGALTGDRTIILPRGIRRYTIRNATSYPFKLTVKMSVGAGVVITQGRVSSVFTDNANTLLAQTDFAGAALTDTPTAPTAPVGTNTDQIGTTKHLRDTLTAHGLGVSKVLKGDIDAIGAPSGLYSFSAGSTGFAEYSSLIKLPYVDDRYSAQIGLVLSGTEPKLAFRTCAQPNVWGPTRYAWHDGNFDPSTKADKANTYTRVETDASVRATLNMFGLGATNTGSVSSAAQLPGLASGHYYYAADFSPYGSYAFVQRTTYASNRGFEVANIPYTDRFMGRSSNSDGTWRAPVEFATAQALQAGLEGILAGLSINKAPNGYIKLPASMGGLILQWGNVAPVPAAGTTVTFPMAFPNTVLGVYPSIITPTPDDYEIMTSNVGLQTFVLRSYAVQIPNAYWFALGY